MVTRTGLVSIHHHAVTFFSRDENLNDPLSHLQEYHTVLLTVISASVYQGSLWMAIQTLPSP